MPRFEGFTLFSISNLLVIAAIAAIIYIIFFYSTPIFIKEGLDFILSSTWDPLSERYGILFAIGGSFVTATIAVVVSLILSIASAIAIVELVPRYLRGPLSLAIDIMAAIPSVVYGLWGLLVLSPLLKTYIMDPLVNLGLGGVLGVPRGLGLSIFSASITLSIMVTPYAISIIKESLSSIPQHIREALVSLGLTKWEYIKIELGYIRNSILTAIVIAYGRAIGETTAVAMIIGNTLTVDFYKIFNPGYTISSLIANQYPNAEIYKYMLNALFGATTILFVISLIINIALHVYGERVGQH